VKRARFQWAWKVGAKALEPQRIPAHVTHEQEMELKVLPISGTIHSEICSEHLMVSKTLCFLKCSVKQGRYSTCLNKYTSRGEGNEDITW
jgi:hypothetical protein